MSNTAENFESHETASTEGLDTLFSQPVSFDVSGFSENPGGFPEISCESHEIQEDDTVSLSVSEAVDILQISRSTIYRHAQEGKLRSETAKDGKLRILVKQNEIPETSQEVSEIPETTSGSPAASRETVEILNGNLNSHASVDVDSLLFKLESATYRIGYLEAQLESKEEKIKLLTDSQNKPTHWQRFVRWFMGR